MYTYQVKFRNPLMEEVLYFICISSSLIVNILENCGKTFPVEDAGYIDLMDDGSKVIDCNMTIKCAADSTISLKLFVSISVSTEACSKFYCRQSWQIVLLFHTIIVVSTISCMCH